MFRAIAATAVSILLVVPVVPSQASELTLEASEGRSEASSAVSEPTRIAPVVVTADRISRRIDDVPAHVTLIDRERIDRSAAQTVDDLLRSVPGFHLFRRQTSLVSNPTSQGVTMRGLGPNAASRALVLVDGVPLNDPFGGWVYWSKIPMESIERIELVRGGGSSVWGNSAMGGVINILTKRPSGRSAVLRAEGGNRGTADVQGFAGERFGKWDLALDANYFHTDGFKVVAEDEEVDFDTRADSEHIATGFRLDRALSPRATTHVAARYFHEERDNGTRLTGNETHSGFFRAGVAAETSSTGGFETDIFGTVQKYESDFSAQDRIAETERPALDQFDVPSYSVGANARWWGQRLERHSLLAGFDMRWVDGETREDFRNLGSGFTRRRKAGGSQGFAGAYLQDVVDLGNSLEMTAAVRFDVWRSDDGFRKERDKETGATTIDDTFGSRTETFVSPKIGLLYRISEDAEVRAAFYRGFRAPTLNELYRPFRVRNDITEANPDLDFEKLTGVEAGAGFRKNAFDFGVTGFWNRLDDPIANVTVAPGPGQVEPCGFVPDGGVCRRRDNLGHIRALGVEAELAYEPSLPVGIAVSYAFTDSEIRDAPKAPALEGNRVPQVPKHQVVVRSHYDGPWQTSLALEFRYSADQYEDDLNTRKLDDYFVVNARIGKRFSENWEVFVRGENVFGDRYEVGKTADGLTSLGPPALVHAGVRYSFPE